MSTEHTVGLEVARATPAVAVSATSWLLGIPWDTIVYVLTAVLVALQITFLVRDKWWRDRKDRNGSDD